MSLILPRAPAWAYCTDNLPTTPSATAFGAPVTVGANNVDGADVALFSSPLAHDVEYLRIAVTVFRQAVRIHQPFWIYWSIHPVEPLIPFSSVTCWLGLRRLDRFRHRHRQGLASGMNFRSGLLPAQDLQPEDGQNAVRI
jgi:hypothetical protein